MARSHVPLTGQTVRRRTLVGLCALSGSIATGVAVAAVNGNAQAIAFERAAYAVDNRAPGYGLVETGSFAMRALPGASGTVHFALDWGTGVVPGGWTAAIGSVTYAQQRGLVAGVDLVLTPAATSSRDIAIEVVTTRHGVYWRPYRRRACFTRWSVRPSFERAVGSPLFALSGRFDTPPSQYTTTLTFATSTETIHATKVQRVYAWGGRAQKATELDSFATSTKAAFASAISVAADGAGHPGFTIEQQWSAERRTPAIPAPAVCA